jgi:diacylglycerol kinase family enzyme
VRAHDDRRARIAALVALAFAAIVFATLVELVFKNLLAMLVALALLVAAGTAAWIGLTHRGRGRTLGLASASLAFVGLAVALIAFGVVGELLVIVAASASFAFAGRAALRRVRRLEPETPGRRRLRPVLGRKVLIMNPKSGGGKVETFGLVDEARRRGIDPILLRRGDDLRAVAREAARTADVIGMAGGDGSQALVAQVAMEQSVAFVCVPAGTRNHLALDLGLDRDDVVAALDAFEGENERLIDLAFVNEHVFVNNVSLGIYAQIVQSEAYRDAKLETMETLLPELLGPEAAPFDLRYRDGDGTQRDSAQLILVSNNAYVLDRLAGMGSRPRLDTGRLGIVAAEISGSTQAAAFVALEALGQVRRFGGWREWSAEEFEVTSSSPIAAGIDGEATVLDPPLRFRVERRALTVRIPPNALGLSPAAARPTLGRESIRELWRVTAARR